MKVNRYVIPLGLAAMMTAVLPMEAAANSPAFARTEEEWAGLRDDVMEYGEIPGLVREYNFTVQKNWLDYQEYLGKDRDDIEKQYRRLAEDYRGKITGDDEDAFSDMENAFEAKNAEEKADNSVDDGTIKYWEYQQSVDSVVADAQKSMITYHKNLLAVEPLEKNVELQEALYNSATVKASNQMGTQVEVLTAQENLQNARQAVEDAKAAIISSRQSLCVMLGWRFDANPVIQDVPAADMERIAVVNPEEDRVTALSKNYTLQINKRKSENAKAENVKANLARTIASNEQQIASSVTTAYQALRSAKAAYDQAEADSRLAEANLLAAERQFQAGTVSRLDYLQQQYNQVSKKTAADVAALDLFQAQQSYDWTINGLASVGQ